MRIKFYKLSATGNDFILFYNLKKDKSFYSFLAQKVCNRHYGIGADGILVLNKDKKFFLRYFNSDGSEAFCGNGTRAAAFWLKRRFKIKSDFFINTIDGKMLCKLDKEDIFVEAPKLNVLREINLSRDLGYKEAFYIFAGTHHLVIFEEDIDKIDVVKHGSLLRYHEIFKPHGVNVNFINVVKKDDQIVFLKIRTYEKGVEDETLSCASGCASSFYVVRKIFGVSNAIFLTKGGERLDFHYLDDKVFMKGSVYLICKGEFYL